MLLNVNYDIFEHRKTTFTIFDKTVKQNQAYFFKLVSYIHN